MSPTVENSNGSGVSPLIRVAFLTTSMDGFWSASTVSLSSSLTGVSPK